MKEKIVLILFLFGIQSNVFSQTKKVNIRHYINPDVAEYEKFQTSATQNEKNLLKQYMENEVPSTDSNGF